MNPNNKATQTLKMLGGEEFINKTRMKPFAFNDDGMLTLRVPKNKTGVSMLTIREMCGKYEVTGYQNIPNSLSIKYVFGYKSATEKQLEMILGKLI